MVIKILFVIQVALYLSLFFSNRRRRNRRRIVDLEGTSIGSSDGSVR